MLHAPDVYMEKLAIGPGFPDDLLHLDMTPADANYDALASAKNCSASRFDGLHP